MGEDVARFDDRKLSWTRKLRIGFVFQSFQLIPHLTVLENVEMPLFYARVPRSRRRRRCRGICRVLAPAHEGERDEEYADLERGGRLDSSLTSSPLKK